MALIDKFSYRPEVDGLRAVAVVAVILYHGGFGCPGGFVGVDVFFVISGFLITSLIWKDLERRRFSFFHFWERRARRIVPALVVVTLATMIIAWNLPLLPLEFESLGKAVVSQALFVPNHHYWQNTGYFEGDSGEKPLLHTWSLGVEEQFYFIVPVLFWFLFRHPILRTRSAVFCVIGIGFIMSLGLSIWVLPRHASATFYLLPTRAWELLLGSAAAFFPTVPKTLDRRLSREILSLAGISLVLIPVFAYSPETPFPGAFALPPCLGTAVLIWANGGTTDKMRTVVGTVLSMRPIVFVGLISYSLYLWHWPLIAFSNYAEFGPPSTSKRVTILLVGVGLAVLSWKFVETPFRERRLGKSRNSMFAFAGLGLALLLACGTLGVTTEGFPQRFSKRALEYAGAVSDRAFLNELNVEDVNAGRLVPIGLSSPEIEPTVLVWGDSHAMAAMPAVDALLKECGLAGLAATRSSTPPLLDRYVFIKESPKQETIAFNSNTFSYIKSRRIRDVVLIARWKYYVGKNAEEHESLNTSLLQTVRQLVEINCRPWVLMEVPNHSFDIPRALAISQSDLGLARSEPDSSSALDSETIGDLEAAGCRVLDPKPRFLDPVDGRYRIERDGIALYCDAHHLSTNGARLILLPFLRDSMSFNPR